MTTPKLVLTLPPDSHPENIRGEFLQKDPALLATAREAMSHAYAIAGAADDLARSVKDRAKLVPSLQPKFESAVGRFARAIDALGQRRAALEQEVTTRVVGDGRDPVHAEVRAHLKSQRDGGLSLAMNAARLGDRRTVAAVLSAPAYLSGMSPAEHAQFAAVAREMLEPEAVGLIKDIDMNAARVQKASVAFAERAAALIRAWRSGDDELIAKKLEGTI
ncbi:MAG: hypothetical protein O9284_09390 [Steroidobacteraceae bacterium]|jgi:hypothetical protein|nr:hypothetical protein [Steroidobacteraceae bacterium]